MTPKLSKELSDALNGGDQLHAVDPATGRLYVIVDSTLFQKTCDEETHEAIQRGIDSMEAGNGEPLDVVMNQIRDDLRTDRQ